MVIEVDLTGRGATAVLVDPDDFGRFHLAARGGDPTSLGRALEGSGLGRLAGDHAFVDVEALRRLARRDDETWSEGFAAMVAYARSKGWLDETSGAIRAHVEWADTGDALRAAGDGHTNK